jgi:tellurite resistance protein
MTISWLDRSNYYRGLLILARRDGKVSRAEREMMIRIGLALDFDRRFCTGAIAGILENTHITDEPPTFDTPGVAERFLRDGAALAFADRDLHPREEEWLRRAAAANGVDPSWLDRLVRATVQRRTRRPPLEAYRLLRG